MKVLVVVVCVLLAFNSALASITAASHAKRDILSIINLVLDVFLHSVNIEDEYL